MPSPGEDQARAAGLLVTANRAAVYGLVSRWLMHDLRGPAQALSLVSDLVEHGDSPTDPAVRASLQEAAGRLRHLLDLLDGVLRVPAALADPQPVALREPVGFVVALLGCCRLQVELEAREALEPLLPAVRGANEPIAHALLNLVVNACEAVAASGGGTVRLAAGVAPGGDLVRLVVSDDGAGVPPELRERLFEPFTTTKAGRSLAGLGLPVARQLAEQLGGTVRYEPGEPGARFVLELPVWR
ncbi:MAG TPA: ATP-binding protein [Gemmatimonadales bacterium]|nr:ATP-binding protein [Gemmatimonadales bacterium]